MLRSSYYFIFLQKVKFRIWNFFKYERTRWELEKEQGLWGQTDRVWIFSFPLGFDLGNSLSGSICMLQMMRLESRRWSQNVLLNFYRKSYNVHKLAKGWFVRVVEWCTQRLKYSRGDSGTESDGLKRQLKLKDLGVFLQMDHNLGGPWRGKARTKNSLGCFHLPSEMRPADSPAAVATSPWGRPDAPRSSSLSSPASLSSKQPANEDLGSL